MVNVSRASWYQPNHPQSNGMVEHFHRSLKTTLRASDNASWSKVLPIILLGFCLLYKKSLQTSAAEIVYGSTLHLPCEFLSEFTSQLEASNFVEEPSEHTYFKTHLAKDNLIYAHLCPIGVKNFRKGFCFQRFDKKKITAYLGYMYVAYIRTYSCT